MLQFDDFVSSIGQNMHALLQLVAIIGLYTATHHNCLIVNTHKLPIALTTNCQNAFSIIIIAKTLILALHACTALLIMLCLSQFAAAISLTLLSLRRGQQGLKE